MYLSGRLPLRTTEAFRTGFDLPVLRNIGVKLPPEFGEREIPKFAWLHSPFPGQLVGSFDEVGPTQFPPDFSPAESSGTPAESSVSSGAGPTIRDRYSIAWSRELAKPSSKTSS